MTKGGRATSWRTCGGVSSVMLLLALFVGLLSAYTAPAELHALRRMREELHGLDFFCGWRNLSDPNYDPCCSSACSIGGVGASGLYGIICANSDSTFNNCEFETHVVSVILQGMGLAGEVPAEISAFTHVVDLILSFNNYITAVPPTLWNMSSIQYLDLSVNNISSPMPDSLGAMTSLEALVLADNLFYGPFPDVSGLANLRVVHVAVNCIEGFHPSLWSSHKLYDLDMSGNCIYGSIPKEIGSLETSLIYLSLLGAGIEGQLPDELCQLTLLEKLGVGLNPGIGGTIPPCMGEMYNLRFIDMQSAGLTGTIPGTLVQLPLLTHLQLSSNQLEGEMPSPTEDSLLALIMVADNNLTGGLPRVLDQLINITTLDFSNNNFAGTLPPWNFYASPLEEANFHNNHFVFNEFTPLPFFWKILPTVADILDPRSIERCQIQGLLSYLDISGNDFGGQQLDSVIIQMIDDFVVAWQFPCNAPQIPDMQGLALSGCNLGSFAFLVFYIFPNLLVLDLSGNGLAGVIPNTYPLPSQLQILDMSENRLYGTLPAVIGRALELSLSFMDLSGNPALIANYSNPSQLPDFLIPQNGSYLTFDGLYSCPSLTASAFVGINVRLDPTFYDYTLCFCNTNYYGFADPEAPAQGCLPAANLCLDNTTDCYVASSTGVFGGDIKLQDGYYPVPSADYVLGLLPCTNLGFDGETICRASQLDCKVLSGLPVALSCTGNPCPPGYMGQQCSGCISGYFLDGMNCRKCPENASANYVFIATISSAAFAAAFAVCRCGAPTDARRPASQAAKPRCGQNCMRSTRAILYLVVSELGIILIFAAANLSAPWEIESLGIILLFILLALVLDTIRRPADDVSYKDPRDDPTPMAFALLKSLVIYLQTLSAVTGPMIANILQQSENFSLSVTGLECVSSAFENYFTRYLTIMSIPLLITAVIALWSGVRLLILLYENPVWRGPTTRNRFWHSAQEALDRSISANLLIFNLFFFDLVNRFFTFFGCTYNPVTHNHYNTVTPRVLCYTKEAGWSTFAAISIGLFVLYLLGLGYVIRRIYLVHRRLSDQSVRLAYGFVYEPYKHAYWWYDIFVFFRRILLAFCLAIIPAGPFQTLGVIVVLLGGLSLHMFYVPHLHNSINIIEGLALAVPLASYIVTQGVSQDHSPINYTVVALNLAVLVIYLIIVVYVVSAQWVLLFPRRGSKSGCCGWIRMKIVDIDDSERIPMGRTSGRTDERTPLVLKSPLMSPPSGRDSPRGTVSATTSIEDLLRRSNDASMTPEVRFALEHATLQPLGSEAREAQLVSTIALLTRRFGFQSS